MKPMRKEPDRAGRADGSESPARAGTGETFQEVMERRMARRSFLKMSAAAAPVLVIAPAALLPKRAGAAVQDGLTFAPIALSTEDAVRVPPGYVARVLLRWGDPLLAGAPPFDLAAQSPAAQARQVGYNCDFLGFFPWDDDNPRRGLLTVNHEYTNPELMFPGYDQERPTRAQVDVEIAAHGLSVVEIERSSLSGWEYRAGSPFNRRVTGETEMAITGPAAGDDLLKVSYDPTGTRVRGMLNNCGGGITPWGTLLTCEENFNQYFANRAALSDADPRKAIHARYGLPGGASERRWELHHERFDLAREPNEPFRFGWVVEIDPYDGAFVPRKRTALGRFKHEAATVVLARDGRAAVYSGDDERFDYVYKFVSRRAVDPVRSRNLDLLDEGALHVARFDVDDAGRGIGEWIPLEAGRGALAGWTEAQILINTRGAADAVGATKMDRPEDLETNPVTGRLYCVFTNNTQRGTSGRPGVDAANPRPVNRHGHILEISEDGEDAAATTFTWEIFMLCGDPADPADAPTYFAGFDPARVSPISSPDNIAFDGRGNLWIATDGQINTFRRNDGIFAVPTEGPDRGYLRQFLSGVPGGEVASLIFTPDTQTLFASIQHPGEGSSLSQPTSRWPDGGVPRPAVVAVTKSAPRRRSLFRPGSPVIGT
jgi:hypothetical protein